MTIRHVRGDLLDQPVEAIVNSWNRNTIPWWLLLPHGVSGAIKRCGGTSIFRELARHGRMERGQAVATSAGRLPFRAILHLAILDDLWRASEPAVRTGTRNTVRLAEEQGLASIAFPLLGAGIGGLAPESVKRWMEETIREMSPSLGIVIVEYDKP